MEKNSGKLYFLFQDRLELLFVGEEVWSVKQERIAESIQEVEKELSRFFGLREFKNSGLHAVFNNSSKSLKFSFFQVGKDRL